MKIIHRMKFDRYEFAFSFYFEAHQGPFHVTTRTPTLKSVNVSNRITANCTTHQRVTLCQQ